MKCVVYKSKVVEAKSSFNDADHLEKYIKEKG